MKAINTIGRCLRLCAWTVAAMSAFAPFSASALTETVDGIEWTYTVSDGKAAVGDGSNAAIDWKVSEGTDIVVPSALGGYPVVRINKYAFRDLGIASVTIPEGVTEIYGGAFSGCRLLSNVSLPASLENVGDAFGMCDSLMEFHVALGNAKYLVMNRMLVRRYHSDIYDDDRYALVCGINGDVEIPDEVTLIDPYAFNQYKGLRRVTIHGSQTSLGGYAIYNCTFIEQDSFNILPTEIVFTGDRGSMDSGIWECCYRYGDPAYIVYVAASSRGWSFKIPSKVEYSAGLNRTIEFKLIEDLKTENVGGTTWTYRIGDNGGAEIVNYSIGRQRRVAAVAPAPSGAVAVPDALGGHPVVRIAGSAFDGCSGMTSLAIPESVVRIDDDAFTGCTKLTQFSVTDGNAAFKANDGIVFSADGVTLVRFPSGRAGTYAIPNDVEVIGEGAFYAGALTGVILPCSVRRISDGAFYGSSKLAEAVLGAGVLEIGECAFQNAGLKSVTLPTSITNIYQVGSGAFDSASLKSAFAKKGANHESRGSFKYGMKITYYDAVCTVTLDTNDGVEYPYGREVVPGNAVGLLPEPYREKYKFLGWFTASVGGTKVTDATKVTADVTYYAQWEYDGSAMVSVHVASGQEAMGSVSGAGQVVKAGTKVAIKAVPNKGYVFAGWYLDGEPLAGATDYRTASYNYIAPGDREVELIAYFATKQEDIDSLRLASMTIDAFVWRWMPYEEYLDAAGTFTFDLSPHVWSITMPKVAVSGLPKGLKFDAKTLVISGKADKPGTYTVKVSLTNTSVKKAKDFTFLLRVPNLTCEALPNISDSGTVSVGRKFVNYIDYTPVSSDWTVTVSDLPAGLKWDSKSGKIIGTPTKPGTYTVTITAKKGKETQVATTTMNVEALPSYLIGTFHGVLESYSGVCGSFQMTATDVGKLSAKITTSAGSYSLSADAWDTVDTYNGTANVKITSKGGDQLELEAGYEGYFQGNFTLANGKRYSISGERSVFGQTWRFKAEATNSENCWNLTRISDAKSADVTVTVKDGAAKLAGKVGGYNVSSSCTVRLNTGNSDIVTADFTPVVSVGKVKTVLAVHVELYLHNTESGNGTAALTE